MEKKRFYIAPQIELICIDNDISLALQSTPPAGPSEISISNPEKFGYNPMQTINV